MSRPVTPQRECVRCGDKVFWREPHTCADIAKRLAKREKQVLAVEDILGDALDGYGDTRKWAEAIVQKLANMGVEND